MSKNKTIILLVIGVVAIIGIAFLRVKIAKSSLERVTGHSVTWWDAMSVK